MRLNVMCLGFLTPQDLVPAGLDKFSSGVFRIGEQHFVAAFHTD